MEAVPVSLEILKGDILLSNKHFYKTILYRKSGFPKIEFEADLIILGSTEGMIGLSQIKNIQFD